MAPETKEEQMIVEPEEYQDLSPDEREQFVFDTLSELIHENPEGLTRSDILDVTPFGRKTLDKHLERLVALNEAYVRRMGGTDVYYPNGRMLRPNSKWETEIGDELFRLTLLENISGRSIYLQEIEDGDYGEEAKGGLLISRDHFDSFIDWLNETRTEVKQFDE